LLQETFDEVTGKRVRKASQVASAAMKEHAHWLQHNPFRIGATPAAIGQVPPAAEEAVAAPAIGVEAEPVAGDAQAETRTGEGRRSTSAKLEVSEASGNEATDSFSADGAVWGCTIWCTVLLSLNCHPQKRKQSQQQRNNSKTVPTNHCWGGLAQYAAVVLSRIYRCLFGLVVVVCCRSAPSVPWQLYALAPFSYTVRPGFSVIYPNAHEVTFQFLEVFKHLSQQNIGDVQTLDVL
jgi:hypothetical protein